MKKIGFSGYLTKPVNRQDLINAISIICNNKEESFFITRHSLREAAIKKRKRALQKASFDKATLLLVEDNAVNQMVATTLLEKYGCTVVTANNGKEAIEQFKQQKFDLIFMDCMMPEMDGFEATEQIRALEKTHKTPIIAFTANAMKKDTDRCLEAGMDDYVAKPVKEETLKATLVKWLPKPSSPKKSGRPKNSSAA